MKAKNLELYKIVLRENKVRKARKSFWHYCKALAPDFYKSKKETPHLWELCNLLDAFNEKRIIKYGPKGSASHKTADWIIVDKIPTVPHITCLKLMINMPPQHGKSRTLVNFSQYLFGKNEQERIITGAYNDDVASDFGRYVRDGISEEKNLEDQIVFSDIFKSKVKHGNSSFKKWALEGQFFSFLTTGLGGSVTGKGATIKITDDLVKGIAEALNETHLQKIWLWYVGTFGSRVSAEEGEAKEIMCFTRWSSKDPCGIILDSPDAHKWYVHKREVWTEEQGMLCPALFNRDAYEDLKAMSLRNKLTAMIFWANYHQRTIDVMGRLYSGFGTYEKMPEGAKIIKKLYCDTAEGGGDYLCSIVYYEIMGLIYVVDVVYSNEDAAITEKKVMEQIIKHDVSQAEIEGNNGGIYFARNVKRMLKAKGCRRHASGVKYFKQTGNKETRIYSTSPWCQENILFPVNWSDKWQQFCIDVLGYSKEGKNANDDGPDVLAGICESTTGKIKIKAIERPAGL